MVDEHYRSEEMTKVMFDCIQEEMTCDRDFGGKAASDC